MIDVRHAFYKRNTMDFSHPFYSSHLNKKKHIHIKTLRERKKMRDGNYPFMLQSSRKVLLHHHCMMTLAVLIWIGTFLYILYVYSALTFISWNAMEAYYVRIVLATLYIPPTPLAMHLTFKMRNIPVRFSFFFLSVW